MNKIKKLALETIVLAMNEIKRNLEVDASDECAKAQTLAMLTLARAFNIVSES